jgi:hypothetical protein
MEAVEPVDVTSATLEYASPSAKAPWGPIIFRPSRPAILFLALNAIFATWLGLRHHPWREVALLPSSYYAGSPFTADGQVLTLHPELGANLWNPADGSLLRNIPLDTGTYQYFVVKGGAQILALPHNEKTGVSYDTHSGRIVANFPNPLAVDVRVDQVYPDGSRMVSYGRPSAGPSTRASNGLLKRNWHTFVWDLIGDRNSKGKPVWPPVPLAELFPAKAMISSDGRRILQRTPSGGFVLTDAQTLAIIAAGDMGTGLGGFVNEQVFYLEGYLPKNSPGGQAKAVHLLSARDGKLIRSIPLQAGAFPANVSDRIDVSPDARIAVGQLAAPVATPRRPGGFFRATVHVWDLDSGKLLLSRDGTRAPVVFFPDSRPYLTAEPWKERVAIYSATRRRPIAILPGDGGRSAPGHVTPFVAPDGQTIAVPGDPIGKWLALFRPAGWDCPQSHLGAIAFPHLWLMIASLVATALLLRRDAARDNTSDARAPAAVSAILFAVTLPLTAYGLASLCVEQYWEALALVPAALLLIAAIGLAIGSRFWRLGALCMLAAALPYEMWQSHRFW